MKMDIKDEGLAYKVLCNACLCVGRKLHNITDQKTQKYYLNALEEIPLYNTSAVRLQVCFECKALLEKSIAFREQVQDSYRILQTYTKENLHECLLSDVSRPPRLKVHTLDPISISPSDGSEGHEGTFDTYPEVPVVCIKEEMRDDWGSDNDDTNMLEDTCPLSDSSEITKNFETELQNVMGSKKINEKRNKVDKRKREKKTKVKRAKKRVKAEEKEEEEKPKQSKEQDQKILTVELSYEEMLQERERESTRENYVKAEYKCESCLIGFNYKKSYLAHVAAKHSAMEDKELNFDKLPSRTQRMYLNSYKKFMKWRTEKGVESFKEEVFLTYFEELSKSFLSATLWSVFSRLNTTIQIKHNLNLKKYVNLMNFLKKCAHGYKAKKSKVFTRADIENFLNNAPNDKYLATKDLGDYICPICKTIIPSVESFTAHYKRHMRRYECIICHKRTLDVKVMQQHYYSSHEISLKEYKCNLCGKVSNSIDTHRYHRDTHKARVQCTECDKTFRHRAGLMNHRLTVHEYQNSFPCTLCDKVFRWKTSLKRHFEKHEVKGKSSTAAAYCSMCNVSFASIFSYQRHLKNSLKHVTQDQLKFICDHCNKRFADKTKLRDHIEEKHLHKTYQCSICLKPSKNRVGLDQHIRNVHKGRPNNKMCHHCGKGFPTKVQLESHIRSHTGERPFICEYCPTTFSQQSNLYKHNRQVHLNIKSKRYPIGKRKEEKLPDVPILDHTQPIDPYRPVPILHYNTEKVFSM